MTDFWQINKEITEHDMRHFILNWMFDVIYNGILIELFNWSYMYIIVLMSCTHMLRHFSCLLLRNYNVVSKSILFRRHCGVLILKIKQWLYKCPGPLQWEQGDEKQQLSIKVKQLFAFVKCGLLIISNKC